MSDPAVCAFLTKVVCSHGGRLDCAQLSSYVAGLSEQQLRQILEEGAPDRFLLARAPGGAGGASSRLVLAVSTVRLCPQKECLVCDCERLHLCKLNLLGRCRVRGQKPQNWADETVYSPGVQKNMMPLFIQQKDTLKPA